MLHIKRFCIFVFFSLRTAFFTPFLTCVLSLFSFFLLFSPFPFLFSCPPSKSSLFFNLDKEYISLPLGKKFWNNIYKIFRLGGRITIKKEIKEEEPDESFPGVSSPVFLKQPNVPYKLSGSDVLITKSADLKASTSSASETSSSVTSSETSEALPVTEKEKSDQTIRISTTKTVGKCFVYVDIDTLL